jgi:lipopolysaccharide export system permease protein
MQIDGIWANQESASALTYLVPGTFSKSKSSDSLIYIAEKDGDQMTDFFMVESSLNANGERHRTLTRARNGNLNMSENHEQSFLILEDGSKTVLDVNQAAMQITVFNELGQAFVGKEKNYATRRNATKTSVLMHSTRVGERAELYWRFSIALMLLIICPLAVPLSYVDPRMGKYAKLLPAVAIVLFYQASLGTAKAVVEREAVEVEEGFLLVHSIFLIVVFFVCVVHTRFKHLLKLKD